MSFFHTPVLVSDVLASLNPGRGGIYVDGTVGGAGHAAALLTEVPPDGFLIGIDKDEEALMEARGRLQAFGGRAILVKGDFACLADILDDLRISAIDGLLLDLGVSSRQLDVPERGFSFSQDGPLDMRMDQRGGRSAYDLVNRYPAEDLADLIWKYGEERMAKRIARAIVAKRRLEPLATTSELAAVIVEAMPPRMREGRTHPATRTFQALRIVVNDELESLRRAIAAGMDRLNPGGRLVVISFHSLEDRIVKEAFAWEAKSCICPVDLPVCVCGKQPRLKVLTRKPIRPTEAEMESNPRSRSAKLRAAERI